MSVSSMAVMKKTHSDFTGMLEQMTKHFDADLNSFTILGLKFAIVVLFINLSSGLFKAVRHFSTIVKSAKIETCQRSLMDWLSWCSAFEKRLPCLLC